MATNHFLQKIVLGQYFNFNGVASFLSMFFRLRVLGTVRYNPFMPHLHAKTVAQVNWAALKAQTQVKYVIFDKDNTLTAPYKSAGFYSDEVQQSIEECRAQFGARNVAILSNSAGSKDDPGYKDALMVEETLGIPVIRHPSSKKPQVWDDVKEFFQDRHGTQFEVEPHEVCIVGDRILSDVLMGTSHGMCAVHVDYFTLSKENFIVKFLRKVEGDGGFLQKLQVPKALRTTARPLKHGEDLVISGQEFASIDQVPPVREQLWDIDRVLGFKSAHYFVNLTSKDLMIYALSLGFSKDPMNKEHLKLTYEENPEFKSFPTIGVILAHRGSVESLRVPGMPQFSPMDLLHGEEKLINLKEIKADKRYEVVEHIIDVQDKKKAFVLIFEALIKEADTGEVAAKVQSTMFVRSPGGFGRKGEFKLKFPSVPEEQPSHEMEIKTEPGQAVLYRINSDLNALHVDPDEAAMGGFNQPILHGLCSYGLAARAVYEQIQPEAIEEMTVRFTGVVFPGDQLKFSMWKDGSTVVFIGESPRGECLKGFCEIK